MPLAVLHSPILTSYSNILPSLKRDRKRVLTRYPLNCLRLGGVCEGVENGQNVEQ